MHETYGLKGISFPNKCQTGTNTNVKMIKSNTPCCPHTNTSIFLCWKGIRSLIQTLPQKGEKNCSWGLIEEGRCRAWVGTAWWDHHFRPSAPIMLCNITTEAARRGAGASSPTRHQGLLHVPGQSPEITQPVFFLLPIVSLSPGLSHWCISTDPRCRNSEAHEHYTINGITSRCFGLRTLTAF